MLPKRLNLETCSMSCSATCTGSVQWGPCYSVIDGDSVLRTVTAVLLYARQGIYSAAQRDTRQLRSGFSYVRALLCCVNMTAVLGTSPAMTERTAYAQLARRLIA